MAKPSICVADVARQEVKEMRHVVAVNGALVKTYFPNDEPLGRRIPISMKNEDTPTEIASIVAEVKHEQLNQEATPMS